MVGPVNNAVQSNAAKTFQRVEEKDRNQEDKRAEEKRTQEAQAKETDGDSRKKTVQTASNNNDDAVRPDSRQRGTLVDIKV